MRGGGYGGEGMGGRYGGRYGRGEYRGGYGGDVRGGGLRGGLAVHTQGSAHRGRCTQMAVCSHRRSSAVKFSHHFFYQGSGFFMFLVDVGQLFRCTGHLFMCVTTGPPIRGDPISHS